LPPKEENYQEFFKIPKLIAPHHEENEKFLERQTQGEK